MKRLTFQVVVLLILGNAPVAQAALYASWSGSQPIPEGASGLAFNFSLSSGQHSISAVSVGLNISGGFNGDLYAYLSHGDGFAVLLNRAGRTSGNEDGYSTPGFDVTVASSATPDIHDYESLSPIYNGSGQLTGTWGADGRDVLPEDSYDTIPRTATLNNFTSLDPNGDWTIFFYDASAGGVSTLKGWSVEVSTQVIPVPEPVHSALAIFGAFTFFGGIGPWLKSRVNSTHPRPCSDKGSGGDESQL